jgi:pSer/pThr/pTyr-binding forkhead associated (FHA) protein
MHRQLVVIAGPDAGRTFNLADGQTLVIGRGQASDTQINDPRISRVNCHVQVDGGRTLLIDAGSGGGTAVNGQPVQKCKLAPGDVIYLGDTQIRYQLDSGLEASTLVDQPAGGGAKQAGPERDVRGAAGRAEPPGAVVPLKELVGQSLAHFRLDAIIAKGTTGMVFKAHDAQKNRVVAVKVLDPSLTSDD